MHIQCCYKRLKLQQFQTTKISYPTRLLFDSCSQRYIAPLLRTMLNLQTIDVEEIIINSFGNKSEKEYWKGFI